MKNKTKHICLADDCIKDAIKRGFCDLHYRRFMKTGNPNTTIIEQHGMHGSKEYRVWANMKARCYYKGNSHFNRYGGRGIVVCDKWKNSFSSFYSDMGLSPFDNCEIDRIDNNGNYEPLNCRWVSRSINVQNSTSAKLSIAEVYQIRSLFSIYRITVSELSGLYGVGRSAIWSIVHYKTWVPGKCKVVLCEPK